MATKPQFAFFRDRIVPLEEAKISVMTHAFNYGTACFEGIRGYWNPEKEDIYLLKPEDHYVRLVQSARILQMDVPYSPEQLTEITRELVMRDNYREDVYVRPLVYKKTEAIGVKLHNLEHDLAMFITPMGDYVPTDKGLDVGISSWQRISDNMIPCRAKICGAYVNMAFAKTEAIEHGYDECIMLNAQGQVSEGSAENIFLVRRGQLITPPVTASLLEGITRGAVIELARNELEIPVAERSIERSELFVCEEVFLCGTGAQIAWIASVNHHPVGNGHIGAITQRLRTLYLDIVRGRRAEYAHWLKPVYHLPAFRSDRVPGETEKSFRLAATQPLGQDRKVPR